MTHGIAAFGLKIPSQYIEAVDLATLRGVDPDKLTIGLGCRQIALCSADEDVVTLAVGAAKRALRHWDGDIEDIGLIAVGSETAKDMSRPLSAFVADALGLRGAVRSYEVKHACYGGTLALRQALEWRASGAARGKAALVIAADVALYAPEDPGEPTQGAGAVAMIVEAPKVAEVATESFAWSEPAFDFWRPVGEAFPRVDGPLSLDCYNRGTAECFRQAAAHAGVGVKEHVAGLDKLCFHVPFPKMVKKAVRHLGEVEGWAAEEVAALFESKVDPTMAFNRRVGNAYTASLWLSVATTLASGAKSIAAYSYGSGFGAELLSLNAGPLAADAAWMRDLESDLESRTRVDAASYAKMRARHAA